MLEPFLKTDQTDFHPVEICTWLQKISLDITNNSNVLILTPQIVQWAKENFNEFKKPYEILSKIACAQGLNPEQNQHIYGMHCEFSARSILRWLDGNLYAGLSRSFIYSSAVIIDIGLLFERKDFFLYLEFTLAHEIAHIIHAKINQNQNEIDMFSNYLDIFYRHEQECWADCYAFAYLCSKYSWELSFDVYIKIRSWTQNKNLSSAVKKTKLDLYRTDPVNKVIYNTLKCVENINSISLNQYKLTKKDFYHHVNRSNNLIKITNFAVSKGIYDQSELEDLILNSL